MFNLSVVSTVRKNIAEGDLNNARKIIEQALSEHNDFYLYNEQLGDIARMQGDSDAARNSYNRALECNPSALWIKEKISALTKTSLPAIFCGKYDFYPNVTEQRKDEGGLRKKGIFKTSMENQPLVTIVTAVYDNDKSLQRCIDSVIAQTYPNIEYIIVDGGSPSSTLNIIKKNEESIDYYISEPDKGIYSAMNKGITLARGEFVCLLNSDDYYEPDFVEKSVSVVVSEKDNVDIVYTDYYVGNSLLVAQKINKGIFFGHLHICHNTFLVSKDCYNRVGPYDEDFKIVSDAVWMRKAFKEGAQFVCLNEPLFTLTEGGLSSGNTEKRRLLFISEVVNSYRLIFPQITEEDAEEIYLFRFNKKRTNALRKIVEKYKYDSEILIALKGYVEHCFCDRANFRLDVGEATTIFPEYIKLADQLGVDKRCIKIKTKQGLFSDVLNKIDLILAHGKKPKKKTILHFVTVFSAPSETFIFDLINRLDKETEFDNFVLFEHAELRQQRPYEKAIQVFWSDFHVEVAEQIYKYIVDQLAVDVVIGHFALNEWKWAERTKPLELCIPTISMCHGVDAFSMRDNEAYRSYLIEDFCKRDNTVFTAVSNYLRKELLFNGVPDEKIIVLHNTVNSVFFENRKSDNFYDASRTLKLLTVGRLVPLKGHKYLIKALKKFKETCTSDVQLTIVYGNGDELLGTLKTLVLESNLVNNVIFKSFVDFQNVPNFFAGFDCYIHPSVYSEDKYKRSETFGIAVLEAIAAGLPVISSDAGGLPEVLGNERIFAKIVPHANEDALSAALISMWEKGDAFNDNKEYAIDRLAKFSEKEQIDSLVKVINKVSKNFINVALFSTSTVQGAGYAAFRLHKGLRNTSINSHMFTTVRNHESEPDLTVIKHPTGDNKNWSALQKKPKDGLTIFSLNQNHIESKKLISMMRDYDVINLHWHARFLSVENIASMTNIGKPVVLTIRDMLPITGGCHFFHNCNKWQSNCTNCPQINSKYTNFPSEVIEAKRKNYNFSNITIVVLSQHTKKIIEKTPYFNKCRIEVIPNSIETGIFKPYDKEYVRKEFGLPIDRKVIAYVPSFSSEVKGYKEIINAFQKIECEEYGFKPLVMLIGNETPATKEIKLDKKVVGYIADNDKLARAYSAADVVVVPSLEETFSNTTAEAISCGVPVVGFKTGAIPELVVDGKTGYTFEVGDVDGLVKGIVKVLTGPSMKLECRNHANENLKFMHQAYRYECLFHSLITNKSKLDRNVLFDNNFESMHTISNFIACESRV